MLCCGVVRSLTWGLAPALLFSCDFFPKVCVLFPTLNLTPWTVHVAASEDFGLPMPVSATSASAFKGNLAFADAEGLAPSAPSSVSSRGGGSRHRWRTLLHTPNLPLLPPPLNAPSPLSPSLPGLWKPCLLRVLCGWFFRYGGVCIITMPNHGPAGPRTGPSAASGAGRVSAVEGATITRLQYVDHCAGSARRDLGSVLRWA